MLTKTQLVALHLCFFKSTKKLTFEDLLLIENIAPNVSAPEKPLQEVIKKFKRRSYTKESVDALVAEAEKQIASAASMGVSIVTYFDAEYPQRIKGLMSNEAAPLPLILFVKGDLRALNTECAIAVVGARAATATAVKMSKSFATDLAKNDTCIVSGLAIGCDTAAHLGALASGVGKTIAVMGHGLQKIYPPENVGLANRIIAEGGCLLSIYPFGTDLSREQFRARNAMQVALSDATAVIQAETEDCGTMVTAGHSIKQSIPLLCVDPRQDATGSYAGNAKLLRQEAENGVRRFDPYNVINFMHNLTEIKQAASAAKPAQSPKQITLHMMYKKKRTVQQMTTPTTEARNETPPDAKKSDVKRAKRA